MPLKPLTPCQATVLAMHAVGREASELRLYSGGWRVTNELGAGYAPSTADTDGRRSGLRLLALASVARQRPADDNDWCTTAYTRRSFELFNWFPTVDIARCPVRPLGASNAETNRGALPRYHSSENGASSFTGLYLSWGSKA